MNNKTELIFGYGSLMSYHGLFREDLKPIEIISAVRAQIKGQRGFAKPSRRKIYCMDIDDFKLEGKIIKKKPKQGHIEGLIIKINQKDFPKFCDREGYLKGNELTSYSSQYDSIGAALWNLFQNSRCKDYYQSIINYRKNLRNKINYTSGSYIPHPINLKNLGYAITFIAPGKYIDEYQPSRKKEQNVTRLMNANEVLIRSDVNRNKFLKYTLECIYGGVHGINIKDIIDLIATNSEFFDDVQKDITIKSINKEKEQFSHTIFNNLEIYQQNFGTLDQNLKRSGLNLILNFGN